MSAVTDAVVSALRSLLAHTDPWRTGRGTDDELAARRQAVEALNAFDSAALASPPESGIPEATDEERLDFEQDRRFKILFAIMEELEQYGISRDCDLKDPVKCGVWATRVYENIVAALNEGRQ